MKQFSVVLCCVALALLACDDGNELDFNDGEYTVEENALIYQEALSQPVFTCTYEGESPDSSYYFIGTINGNDVCYFAEDPRYREIGYKVSGTIPVNSKPAASTVNYLFGINADGYDNLYNPSVSIISPAFPYTTSAGDIVKSSLRFADFDYVGNGGRFGEVFLASDEVSPLEGFSVRVQFSYDSKYLQGTQWEESPYSIYLESHIGNQEGSRLELTDLVETETDSTTTYDLRMELDCKLYWQSGKEAVYFGDVKNGVLRTRIVVDK